ncbi:MAG: ferric reductase-like transmembrane domain-containing protein [Candidatus Dormibacteraeota bacterium]|nr:ferric reductase-like transmembrane domain-containing protein [Candidatus Dormibacteraeota bacterium]
MNSTLLWYTTRGAGAVVLILFSATVVLGLLTNARFQAREWPRFATAQLHRDIALLALVFLVLHIVTAVVDPFTHLGLAAALVPFGSYYRTFWLGLGTVAFELMLAIAATSLLRHLIGVRLWRTVHWLAYVCWPVAVLHGVGTGTDASTPWMIGVIAVSVTSVLAALVWRLRRSGNPLADERRAGRHRLARSAP